MKRFKQYLADKGFSNHTIQAYTNYVNYFRMWLKQNEIPINKVTHDTVIEFLNFAESEGKSLNQRSKIFVGIKHYFNFRLKGKTHKNPLSDIHIRITRKTVITDTLEYNRLLEIYEAYPETNNRQKRNKVILGLLIFQGVTSSDLSLLQQAYINLNASTIYIPEGNRTDARKLSLNGKQILLLNEYITRIRPQILSDNDVETHQFILSCEGNKNLKNTLHHLFREIKKMYPEIKNAKQIRNSVIQHRLKSENIKVVQYQFGFRNVSSVERYTYNNLDALQSDLEKYHPLQ